MEVTQNANAWKRYMCSELAGPKGPRLTFESTTTPLKRKREIEAGATSLSLIHI